MGGESGGFNLGNAYGSVVIDVSGVSSAMQTARDAIDRGFSGVGRSIGDSLSSVGGAISSVGDTIAGVGIKIGGLVAPAALFAKSAVDNFVSFDESMTNIQAVTGASADEIKTLSDQILEIGKNSRSGPQAVAEAFYDIAGGVTDASVRMPTLIAAIHASEAGNADLGTTTKALIAIMNGYGLSADKAGFASDVLTQTVAKGYGTMNDFATALPDVTGLANTLGISFDDLGAMMAYITTKGTSASEAGTQLQGMMISLINPTKEMQDALQKIGFNSGKAAIEQLGLAGTFKKFKDAGIDVTQLGGRIEGMRGAINLSTGDAKNFLDSFNLGLDGLTEKTREIQNKSPAAQLDFFNSAMATLSITIGQSLAPALNKLLEQLLPVIDNVLAWVRGNPELVGQIGLLVAAIAAGVPIVIGIGAALSAVGTILGAIGGAIAFVLSPIGLVIAAVVGLAAAYFTNFGGVKDFIDTQVRPVLERVFNWLGTVFETVIKPGLEQLRIWFVETAFPAISKAVDDFKTNVFEPVARFLGDAWTNIISPGLESLRKWFVDEALPAIGKAFNDFKTNVFEPVVNFIGEIWSHISDGLGKFFDWMASPGGGLDQIKKGLNDFKTNVIEPVIKAIQDIWTKVQPFLETLKSGMKSVFDWIYTNVVEPALKFVNDLIKKIQDLTGQTNTSSSNMIQQGMPANMQTGMQMRDVGGAGMAGTAYQIGSGQLQNEVYIPGANGQFVSGFVDLMKQVASGVTGGSSGDTINVMMPEAALANPAAAHAIGQDFGRGFMEEMRSRGLKSGRG